jgi:cyanophycin synthetase
MITLYDKGQHIPLLWTHLVPATLEGRAMHNVQNAMVAAAMAFSLGVKLDAIRQGLRTFGSTFFQVPGRMNVFDEHPVQGDLRLRPQRARGRRDGGPGAAPGRAGPAHRRAGRTGRSPRRGHRRDRRGHRGKFDHYICRRDDSLRGRDGDEVPLMLKRTLEAKGVPSAQISVIPDEQEAIDAALRMGRPATCCWCSPMRWCARGSR